MLTLSGFRKPERVGETTTQLIKQSEKHESTKLKFCLQVLLCLFRKQTKTFKLTDNK